VIGQTQNLSARIAVKGLLCATILTVVLIATLMLVSSADATLATAPLEEGTQTMEGGASSGGTEGMGAETGTAAEGTGTIGEVTPPVEQALPPAETTTPPETTTPAETTPPSETTAPSETTPPSETTTTAETTPTEATHTEEPTQPIGEGLVVAEVLQTTKETVSQSGEVLTPVIKEIVVPASELVLSPASSSKAPESVREADQVEAGAAPTAASSPPAPPTTPQAAILTTFPAIAVTEAPERVTRSAAVAARSLTAAQRAGEISCELSGLTERMSEDCSAGLLSGSSLIAVDPVERAGEVSPARKSNHAGGGYSEPASGDRSGGAPPGPAPGGAFGGSAAAGSGLALSGFFTLTGLLLFAAPCAMRRLRLSCRPWRTAFFVLIPERPG
jgi:hypothetical protein